MIVEKERFNAALAPVDKLARKGRDIPILSHVLLSSRDGDLTIRGSNLDEEITSTMAGGFGGDALPAFTCPSQQLMDFARNAPGTEIEIRLEQRGNRIESVTFLSGRARLRLPVLPADDFPEIAARNFTHNFACDGKILARAIRSVAFAASSDPSRTYLHGVFMHSGDDGLVFVATDSHRLVRQVIGPLAFDEGDLSGMPSVILPSAAIERLLPVIDREGDVSVDLSDACVRFRADGVSVVTKLVDGTFPDYNRVIPQPGQHRAVIGVAQLAAAVKRTMFVEPDKSKRVRFSFSVGCLNLQASADGGLESVDEIPVDCETEITLGFNGRYVLDMLAHCNAEKLEMVTADPGAPALFRAPGETLNLAVLMPLRV